LEKGETSVISYIFVDWYMYENDCGYMILRVYLNKQGKQDFNAEVVEAWVSIVLRRRRIEVSIILTTCCLSLTVI
jgi:hypothetical protein